MKLYILADKRDGWYTEQAFQQFTQHTRHNLVARPEEADLIWIMSYYVLPQNIVTWPRLSRYLPRLTHQKKLVHSIPIVTTIHHLYPPKQAEWQASVTALDRITTIWQTSAARNLPYLQRFIKKPIKILPYWIDLQRFYPLSNVERVALRKKLHIPQDKNVIGSFQRDTEADEHTPKREKGPDIFCDIVEQLDPHTTFVLLTGPRRMYIERRLQQRGIEYQSLGKVAQDMNHMYNSLDYYLVTSRMEGGPQAILEAMATRTKILSSAVGIADILSPEAIFKSPAEAVTKLQAPYSIRTLNFHAEQIKHYDCASVIAQFDDFFESLV